MPNLKKLRMFFEHQLNMHSGIKLSNAFPACHEGLRKKLQLNRKKPSIREALEANKTGFKVDASSRGTEKSQDFVKVENFYFTKRTGED